MTMTGMTTALVFAFVLTVGLIASAHEGHTHKIMGTVSGVHEHSLDVKATDGKNVSVTVSDKTKIIHGAMAMKASDIKAGDRVVVTAIQQKDSGGKPTFTALEVRLGVTSAPRPKK